MFRKEEGESRGGVKRRWAGCWGGGGGRAAAGFWRVPQPVNHPGGCRRGCLLPAGCRGTQALRKEEPQTGRMCENERVCGGTVPVLPGQTPFNARVPPQRQAKN